MKHIVDDQVVAGTGNKYQTRNPLSKYLISQFDSKVMELVNRIAPTSILEIGCGEGHTTELLLESSQAKIIATDISKKIVSLASNRVKSSRVTFETLNIYDVNTTYMQKQFDLIVCCEVFEHIDEPNQALAELSKLGAKDLIISVPNEPLWRILNMARGAYLADLGNTPGHIQHWSHRTFKKFVSSQFEIQSTSAPIPWNLVHAKYKAQI